MPDSCAPASSSALAALAEPKALLWGWANEGPGRDGRRGRSQDEIDAAGWAGVLTHPRLLSVVDGALAVAPAPEVDAYRGAQLASQAAGSVELPPYAEAVVTARSGGPGALAAGRRRRTFPGGRGTAMPRARWCSAERWPRGRSCGCLWTRRWWRCTGAGRWPPRCGRIRRPANSGCCGSRGCSRGRLAAGTAEVGPGSASPPAVAVPGPDFSDPVLLALFEGVSQARPAGTGPVDSRTTSRHGTSVSSAGGRVSSSGFLGAL